MDLEFKGTKGEWSYSPQKGGIRSCAMAQVWDFEGNNLATIEATLNSEEATANAKIMANSKNLMAACKMLISWFGEREESKDKMNPNKVFKKLENQPSVIQEAYKLMEKALK